MSELFENTMSFVVCITKADEHDNKKKRKVDNGIWILRWKLAFSFLIK
jgi:hypothetical protein